MTRRHDTPLPPPAERRRLRESAPLTLAQLAARMGVVPGTVRAWESGRTTPRGRRREAYATLLAALADSAGGTGSPSPPAPAPAAGRQERKEPVVTVSPEGGGPGGRRGPLAPEPSACEQAPPPPSRRLSSPRPAASETAPPPEGEGLPPLTPAQAFDGLYACCAPALVRQAYLLTGRRDLARESVERAFQLAWDRWPEVARDPDPAGWVRAAVHEWALSPWHRFRRRHRHPEPPSADASDRALLEALLHLPPPYRRALLLYDGIRLGLPETAAETEATTVATAGRLLYAREAVATLVPDLSDPHVLRRRLAELASIEGLRPADPPAVRGSSERRARFWTRTALAFTVALIGTTSLTLHTAPTRYEPPVPAGETVRGVPPRVAPGPLSEDQRKLRDKLRKELRHELLEGPERLTPQTW